MFFGDYDALYRDLPEEACRRANRALRAAETIGRPLGAWAFAPRGASRGGEKFADASM